MIQWTKNFSILLRQHFLKQEILISKVEDCKYVYEFIYTAVFFPLSVYYLRKRNKRSLIIQYQSRNTEYFKINGTYS